MVTPHGHLGPWAIATVAPRCDRVSVSGRFGFGIYRWAYLPFDVPAGVQAYSGFHVHSELLLRWSRSKCADLGISARRPRPGQCPGFPGWSGGARDRFEISSAYATPGYLAGPIEPGPWAVALGPVVLSPWGMAWQAHVTMERGPSASRSSEGEAVQPIPLPSSTGARWYRGDLHLHTVHSDGERHPENSRQPHAPAGWTSFVSTEHNTKLGQRAWPACTHPACW